MGMVDAQNFEYVLQIMEAYLKGQWVSKFYVDGGLQVCIMSENIMNQPGLEVSGKLEFKAKIANNISINCVGVCKNVKIMVCGMKLAIDLYVLPTKWEGYPIILSRPWLIAMNARQDWENKTLVLKPL